MDEAISKQHRAFIVAYCSHFNATRAAKDAKFRCASDNAFSVRGHNLLRNINIRDEINRICSEQDEAALANKTFVVNKIKAVLEADLVKYVCLGSEGASESDLMKMPDEIRKMVTQIERLDFYETDINGGRFVSYSRYKFKLIDKTKMIELLAKHTGAVKEGPLVDTLSINQMSYGQLLKKAEAVYGSE